MSGIAGTFLKAGANRDSVHTKVSLERSLSRPGSLIDAHCRAMDEADASEPEGNDPSDPGPPCSKESPAGGI